MSDHVTDNEDEMIRLAIECSLMDNQTNSVNNRSNNHPDYKRTNTFVNISSSNNNASIDNYSIQELAFFTDTNIPDRKSSSNYTSKSNNYRNSRTIEDQKLLHQRSKENSKDSSTYHKNSNSTCRICNKECSAWYGSYIRTEKNDLYHHQCFKCTYCNELINNTSYLVIGDSRSIYHVNCFRCQGCQKKMEGLSYPDKNQPSIYYCQPCYQELYIPKCTICTCTLNNKYYRHPFFESELYCMDHEGISKACFSCNRKEPLPITKKDLFIDLLDGRSLCIDCSNTIIIDSSEAKVIYQNIVHFMERELNFKIPQEMWEVPILLVDSYSLNENMNKSGTKTLGYHNNTEVNSNIRGLTISTCREIRHIAALPSLNALLNNSYTSSLFHVNEVRDVSAVLVLYGLPKDLIASILAHEAMHVWLKLNNKIPFHMTSKIEEGLCQVLSYLYLESISYQLTNDTIINSNKTMNNNDHITHKQQDMLRKYYKKQINEDPSTIYGDGFREMYHIVEVLGIEILLNYIEEHKELPII